MNQDDFVTEFEPRLGKQIKYTDDQLRRLDIKIKNVGGVMIDETCVGKVHRFAEGDPLIDKGCGNELMYEIPYAREMPGLMLGKPYARGTAKVCLICDAVGHKPRFKVV